MKRHLLSILLFISTIAFSQGETEQQLRVFSVQHQFVKMDSVNNIEKTRDYFFYKAVYANVCNRPGLSNEYLDKLKKSDITKSFRYYKLKNDNYIKLFEYKNAYETSEILTSKFATKFTAEELNDEINTQRIWEVLQKQKPQAIDSFTTISVDSKKDLAGLITTEVKANGTTSSFVFDTGAGISCITESMAKKMGLVILPDNNIKVMSFTGVENKVLMGVAPVLAMGSLIVHNAIFLVYPDDAFTFANGAYVINGIIGFPIIKELGTVTIAPGSLSFSKGAIAENKEKNLFIDQLRPVLMLKYSGRTLPYNLDSGAKESSFTKSFYEKFQPFIEANSTKAIIKTSGAGGQEVAATVLELKNQSIQLGGKVIKLDTLQVDPENYGVYGRVNHGNIGQDVLGQYTKVIISFEGNYLGLED
ncbi:retroviral-like aspartic protease family protein [Flavobacterium amniphilum]|uniref:retropepsin-like aspartic protease n=1 Tax=Flavobacterium amniphilum TaxID=1834035 RepID=UPI00202A1379|nr:retropepsin-like aspartic protease [Flavobacterium amniphilum]MCL9805754.1 retroviral-like aspartic protease family protein [Flavobacterium amniphilum]MCL9806341.1 retroviral-like aspartic protease family protein [Flavobacterium amniphilum]